MLIYFHQLRLRRTLAASWGLLHPWKSYITGLQYLTNPAPWPQWSIQLSNGYLNLKNRKWSLYLNLGSWWNFGPTRSPAKLSNPYVSVSLWSELRNSMGYPKTLSFTKSSTVRLIFTLSPFDSPLRKHHRSKFDKALPNAACICMIR